MFEISVETTSTVVASRARYGKPPDRNPKQSRALFYFVDSLGYAFPQLGDTRVVRFEVGDWWKAQNR
jgi:hypothetical protein